MSAEASALLVALSVVSTIVVKAAGPIVLGGRELPAWSTRVIVLLAPALFAALVATQALVQDGQLVIGERTLGVCVGALMAWRRVPIILCVLSGAAATALLRLA